MTNLKAETSIEQVLLDYINNNASEVLTEKINSGTKTLKQCVAYVTKCAKKQAVGGCAMVSDQEVFGWAIHFFEEDSIKGENITPEPAKVEVKKEEKRQQVSEPKKLKKDDDNLEGQMSLFDMMGV